MRRGRSASAISASACGSASGDRRRRLGDAARVAGEVDDQRRAADPGDAAREHPVRVCGREASRIASAIPGTSRSITARVASGVTSRGATPVPPVVSTRSQRSASLKWRRRCLDLARARRRRSRARRPRRRARARTARARRRSRRRSPRAAREVLTVRIATRITRPRPGASRGARRSSRAARPASIATPRSSPLTMS